MVKNHKISYLYAFAAGAAIYRLMKLAEAKQWNKQVIYHPAFASSMAVVALVVTLVHR